MIRTQMQDYERLAPSSLMGALVGATAAAAVMRAALAVQPLFLKEAVSQLVQIEASHTGCMLTAAAIGAASGLVRTAIDRFLDGEPEPIPSILVWEIVTAGAFSLIGGVPGAVLAPFAIVADLAVKGLNANRIRHVRIVVFHPYG